MTEFIFSNNAKSTLATDIGGGDVSFSVADGNNFPSPGSGQGFYIIVEEGSKKEWMLVTSRAGNNFSGITREGSESFAAGSTVRLALNATILNQVLQKGVYRTNAGSPDGSLTAAYAGEEVLDTTNNTWYKHVTATTWKAMTN